MTSKRPNPPGQINQPPRLEVPTTTQPESIVARTSPTAIMQLEGVTHRSSFIRLIRFISSPCASSPCASSPCARPWFRPRGCESERDSSYDREEADAPQARSPSDGSPSPGFSCVSQLMTLMHQRLRAFARGTCRFSTTDWQRRVVRRAKGRVAAARSWL
jgi:hypothetical protein